MTLNLGTNRNTNDEASVPPAIAVNNASAVVAAEANPDRIFLSISLRPQTTDSFMFIRLFPASERPNEVVGEFVGRFVQANDTFFIPRWTMSDRNIYTGEVSVILATNANPPPILEVADEFFVTEY